MGSSSPSDTRRPQLRRHEVVADLAQQALETDDLDRLLDDTTATVAESLDAEYCAAFELRRGEDELGIRQGVGWHPDDADAATVPADRDSPTGNPLRAGESVLADDLETDDRFSRPDVLADHDVVSGVGARIGSNDDPWGVLGAYATDEAAFTESDAAFLERVADVLASAVEADRERRELERECTRQERRFEAIFEDPNILVGLLDPDGTVVDVNGTAMEYVDADLADVTGEPFWETPWWGVDEEVRAEVRRWTERAADGEYVEFEADLTRPAGSRYTLSGVFRPITNDEGEVVSVVVSDRDITERKGRERQLSTLMDNVPGMVYRCRNERGWPMEFVSDACEALTGYDPAALERGDVDWGEDVMVQEDRQKLWETVQREAGEGETFSDTYRIETADGEERWVRDYGRGVFDEAGTLVGIEGIIADVTERKRLESKLEASERRYRTLVEHFPSGAVALVDRDLRYRTVGGNPVDVADVTTEEAEGEPVRDVLPPELADELAPRYEAALNGESSEFEAASNDRVYNFQIVPVRGDDGDVVAALGMSQDVTEQTERERYLQDAKSQLEAATEAGAVGTWEWDIQADEMVVGPSFARTFGVDPDAAREGVSLDRFIAAIHEDDRDRVEREIEAAVESCGEYETEYRVWNADDELRWVVARGRVECDETGDPVRFPGALTDITERKRAELELQRNNEQLETLFEILPVGVVVADADGRLVEANDTAREIWGGDVFDADSVAEYDRYSVRRVDTGERVAPEEMTLSRVLRGEEVREPDVYEIDGADGEPRIIEVEGMPIRDETGVVTRGVVTVTDVTERTETQRQLAESERRYRTLVENFPEGAVALFDEDLEYTAAGGHLFDEVGLSSAGRVGNSLYEIYPDHLLEEIEPHFEAALDGDANSFEAEFHDRHLYASTLPVRNAADEIFAGMLVVRDVTERREYERKLEESNERLEQFAYAASHDLQEPLRMVTSYLQLLENRYGDAFDEDGEEFLQFAVDGAERMREMIDGLLEYSRVETRGDPFEPVDLDAIVDEVLADLSLRIDESDAEITTADLPRVEGDASQLRQVFQNLLSNAIAYSGDETPRVHVDAERRGRKWVISVRDEGIGIDPDDQDRVFTIFDRLHSREEYEGTGIGLALCERIVERHGGDIWVESDPGEGSTFSFTLPAMDDDR
ncbi:PAS domain S-box protein [Halosolutus amylolyticus]|uniref:histidine kinase n=1 Tax=Halosolutus amylolyticus TaxID=2932267 RepID=A0ABD5PLK3_9EURY|nr:PAS domain S-box protein [Halosolutus amylolyticus]